MSFAIPRPARDIIEGFTSIRNTAQVAEDPNQPEAINAIFSIIGGGAFTRPPASKMICAMLRTSLAALAILTVCKLGLAVPVAAVVGSLISLPAVIIAGGSWMMYHGATAVMAALATGAFPTLGIGLACLAGGYIALELHDIIPFGIGDFFIQRKAEDQAPALIKMII